MKPTVLNKAAPPGRLGTVRALAGVATLLLSFALSRAGHAQTAALDFGDAPAPYPTLAADDGARHIINAKVFLGRLVDADKDGQPSADATGDDINNPNNVNDEDGVQFLADPPFRAGVVIGVTVTASMAGFLDAWIDFNRNGTWNDAGEKIFDSVQLVAGANSLRFTVPPTAVTGISFARFRFSTKGGLLPTGLAGDGEVEDYLVKLQSPPLDYGDAPQQYPVLLAQDGARHQVVKGFQLGQLVDLELDGNPSTLADGDDTTPAGVPDDEDGVNFKTALIAGQTAQVEVLPSAQGFIDAWVDFNGNGTWDDPGEQIAVSTAVVPGSNVLSFTVPSTALIGQTFARFRLSSKGQLKPTGFAPDGEVEDYAVKISAPAPKLDFGDAPQNYPVMLSQDGARHAINLDGPILGKLIDAEPDGQPSALADGDDLHGPPGATAPPDDEDGVVFVTALRVGQDAQVDVTVSTTGRLDAWIDFNKNGSWSDAGEQIFTSVAVVGGVNSLHFTVPATALVTDTFARFRVSRQGGLKPTGAAPDGEVEDYPVTIQTPPPTLDFGDAPENYPVLLSQDGARHLVTRNGPILGRIIDAEPDGQPSALANGDDNSPPGTIPPPDDEDGVTFTSPLRAGDTATVQVLASAAGRLDAWIDFNKNGSWSDAGEQIFTSIGVVAGANDLTFTVPSGAVIGDTFARFRISSQGGLKPTGGAPDGEVEDYLVTVQPPAVLDFGDAPQPYPVTLAQDGARHKILKGLNLGRYIDAEPDGQPSALADGDDTHPTGGTTAVPDDEDGVNFITSLIPGTDAAVQVTVVGEGHLDAWVDFNRNGSWDDKGEQIFVSLPIGSGVHTLRFAVPDDAVPGDTFARFRLSRAGGLKPTGLAADGEVEDYLVRVDRGNPDCNPRTHRGTDFWLTFPGNYAPDPDNPIKLTLTIVGPRTTSGKVEIPGLGFSVNFVIPVNEVVIPLPKEADLGDANDNIDKKGIHVTASAEVAVYGLNRVNYTTDGYLGLPSDVIGRRYIIQAYKNVFTGVPDLNGTQFAIVGNSDNTTVAIFPRITTGLHPANTIYAITLNQGETYQLRNTGDFPADLTGAIIFADKPISVFGSHQCAAVPSSTKFFCNHLVEQLVPIERAGNQFLTMPFKTRSASTFRFQALYNTTFVIVNGVPVALLNAGEFHESLIPGPAQILSSKPILVTQYSDSSDTDLVTNSDPFMVVVPQTGQFLKNYEIATPNAGFADNYINIIAPAPIVGALLLDGAAVPVASYTPIPTSIFYGAQVKVAPGVHILSGTQPFGAAAYGYAEYDGYGYPGGMFFGDTMPPRLTCPQDTITVQVSGVTGTTGTGCTVPIPDLRGQVTVEDNCGMPREIVITQNPAPGTLVGPGEHPIVLSTPDANGNIGFCIVRFVVVDPSPLQITCPQDMLVRCNGEGGAKVEFKVTARKKCATDYDVTCEPPSGSFFPEGTTTVNCSATDENGNVVTCSFKITVDCSAQSPTVTISHADTTHVTISWSSGQVLETASAVNGPWNAVADAQSPYTVQIQGKQAYFRLH